MQRSPTKAKNLLWLLGAVLCVLQCPPSARAQRAITVRSVELVRGPGQPQIEIKTSSPVSPATQAVVGPDRIVIDFPGALPADTLKKLAVHRAGLKRIRTGLFQANPPITRVVLDVDGPTDYQVVPSGNSVVIKLGNPTAPAKTDTVDTVASAPAPVRVAMAAPMPSPAAFRAPRLPSASLPALQVVNTVSTTPAVALAAPVPPPRPKVDVGVRSNLLSIRAQGATLAEVLYEVHRRTGADIAIPAGAEQERVVVNIPSAPGRDVIASLLNGSRFNYIVLGADTDPGGFRNLLLSMKEGGGGGSSGVFVHNTPPPGGALPSMQQAPIAPAPDTGTDQTQMDPAGVAQAAPELEPIPDEPPPAEPETSPDNSRPVPQQQTPIQNIPEAGQVPQ